MTGEPRCAVGVPNVGPFGDPLLLVELAVAAEEQGWDGFFVWDHLLYHDQSWDVADPVAVIAAVAARTARIRIGVLVNVLARRRIGEVARESVTVDLLSGGRLVVGAGLGSLAAEFTAFGESADPRRRVRGSRASPSGHGLGAVRLGPTGTPGVGARACSQGKYASRVPQMTSAGRSSGRRAGERGCRGRAVELQHGALGGPGPGHVVDAVDLIAASRGFSRPSSIRNPGRLAVAWKTSPRTGVLQMRA